MSIYFCQFLSCWCFQKWFSWGEEQLLVNMFLHPMFRSDCCKEYILVFSYFINSVVPLHSSHFPMEDCDINLGLFVSTLKGMFLFKDPKLEIWSSFSQSSLSSFSPMALAFSHSVASLSVQMSYLDELVLQPVPRSYCLRNKKCFLASVHSLFLMHISYLFIVLTMNWTDIVFTSHLRLF